MQLGEYIIFLDQDDILTENSVKTYMEILNKNGEIDLILGNGLIEDKNGYHKIFENKNSQNFATKKTPYIKARDFIVSPGQCLIKKEKIPQYWKENILNNNGTDDYLLWLLMFNDKIKIYKNYNIVYKHNYTGENLSNDEEKMNASRKELLEVLKKYNKYNIKDYKSLKRTIEYKQNYKKSFMKYTIRNLDIFLYNIYYRMTWKGYISK